MSMSGLNSFRRGMIRLSRRCRFIIREYGQRLGILHARRPALVEKAVRDYADAYWPSFSCPVFKGFQFASPARNVLKLLAAMGVPQIRVICFGSPDSWIAARWEKLLRFPRTSMTFRRPPNGASPGAKKWIAIDALFPVSGKNGELSYRAATGFSLLLRVAAQLILIERMRTNAAVRKDSGKEQDSDASDEKPPP